MPELDLVPILLLALAGLGAGMINTIVGSGSLITFPALLAVGYPPVLANVTNNLGVLPGSISGAIGYRRELKGQWRSIVPLMISSGIGGVAGALLLLVLPAEVFNGVVPVLIALACVLVVTGPTIKRHIAARQELARARRNQALAAQHAVALADNGEPEFRENRPGLAVATALSGTYGGYFGAAQGVILLSILSIMLKGSLQRANAMKNVLTAAANFTAGVVFVALTPIDWFAAGIIAVGAIVGGQLGAKLGRRIPELALRITIVVVGVIAIVALLIDKS
ncbi:MULTISPECIES: sulfite exporter TauE/SafE family protein [unclassified Cryobacterium]|uniref:sulfite exporter TauE/SafE family protein n=1 Tax=unclassified Cryobacterium TaxID=2649013 RepID=UPI0014479AEE|nr:MULTISPECIES: sulfite exporter TauE/SafE family protein [unclassified Cryobacterium]